jgi:hypothetical protein
LHEIAKTGISNFRNHLNKRIGNEGIGFLHQVVEGRGQPVDQGARHHTHGLRVLVRQKGKKGGEGAESGGEQDEEWQLCKQNEIRFIFVL